MITWNRRSKGGLNRKSLKYVHLVAWPSTSANYWISADLTRWMRDFEKKGEKERKKKKYCKPSPRLARWLDSATCLLCHPSAQRPFYMRARVSVVHACQCLNRPWTIRRRIAIQSRAVSREFIAVLRSYSTVSRLPFSLEYLSASERKKTNQIKRHLTVTRFYRHFFRIKIAVQERINKTLYHLKYFFIIKQII